MSTTTTPSSSSPAQQGQSPPSSSISPALAKSTKPTAKKSKRSRKPLRRRGAKATEEEGEEEGGAKVAAAGDSSDSDFDPDSGREDDEEDDEEEEEDEDDEVEPKTPATASVERLDATDRKGSKLPTQFDDAQAIVANPAWSDMPGDGEAGSTQLPELDFANLSVSNLDSLPATTKGPSKKQLALQKRLAKSEELKQKDPAAWEELEKERQEKAELKKVARKEKVREKRKERKLAEKEKRTTEGVVDETEGTQQNRQVVPGRPSKTAVALGFAKTDSASSPAASSSQSQPPSSSARPAASTPAPHSRVGPRMSPSTTTGAPPVDYLRAREAYTQRLASDPSYIPKVGKFWGHDDRLASPEVRPLNSFWRGRGGPPMRGGRGGATRGGRGGFAAASKGPDRWTADGKVVDEGGASESTEPAEKEEKNVKEQTEQGNVQRGPRPSSAAPMSAWNHGGFEELEREEKARGTAIGRGGGRGGRGAGRGGFARGGFAGRGGTPGAINPRYAHLPFHPLHRFPPSIIPQTSTPSVPAPQPEQSSKETPAAAVEPVSVSPSTETAVERPVTVRLPSNGVSAAHFALAVKNATTARATEEPPTPAAKPEPEVVKENASPVASTSQATAAASAELRKQQGASILYAADPSRAGGSAPSEEFNPPVASFTAFQQQQQAMMGVPQPHSDVNPYNHQLPPHLQSQAPPPFIPRHSSPAFYPPAPQSFYSADGYPSPGATPPPQLYSPQAPPSASFFLPPRSSRIEIKAPSRDGQSPVPKQAIISSNNTAYSIASQQMEQSSSSVGAVAGPASPSSTRGGGLALPPTSPSFLQRLQHNPYAPYPYSPQQQSFHPSRSSYEYQQEQEAAFHFHHQQQQQQQQHQQQQFYLSQQQSQNPYPLSHHPHPLSNSHSYYASNSSPSYGQGQVHSDPAILSYEQQHQSYGIPPSAPY